MYQKSTKKTDFFFYSLFQSNTSNQRSMNSSDGWEINKHFLCAHFRWAKSGYDLQGSQWCRGQETRVLEWRQGESPLPTCRQNRLETAFLIPSTQFSADPNKMPMNHGWPWTCTDGQLFTRHCAKCHTCCLASHLILTTALRYAYPQFMGNKHEAQGAN